MCRPRAQGAAGAVPGGGRSLPPRPGARSFREERLVALLEAKPASRGVRRHSAALGLLLGAGGGSGERETVAEVTVTGGGGTVADGGWWRGGRWQRPPRVPSFRGLSHGRERAPPGPAWAAGADAPHLDSGHPGRTDLGRHSAARAPRVAGTARLVATGQGRGCLAPGRACSPLQSLGRSEHRARLSHMGPCPSGEDQRRPRPSLPTRPLVPGHPAAASCGDTGKACTAL